MTSSFEVGTYAQNYAEEAKATTELCSTSLEFQLQSEIMITLLPTDDQQST